MSLGLGSAPPGQGAPRQSAVSWHPAGLEAVSILRTIIHHTARVK